MERASLPACHPSANKRQTTVLDLSYPLPLRKAQQVGNGSFTRLRVVNDLSPAKFCERKILGNSLHYMRSEVG